MQLTVDTLQAVIAVTDASKTVAMNSDIWGSIIVPFALLLFFSLAKYVVGVGIKDIRWIDFFAEIAIDMLSIFGAFIIGRYVILSSTSLVLISCMGVSCDSIHCVFVKEMCSYVYVTIYSKLFGNWWMFVH